ncbi:hypothetical protein L0F63_004050, partial [Massospora cicadina]
QQVAKQNMRTLNFTRAQCNAYLDPRSFGKVPCFGLSAGDVKMAVHKSIDVPLAFSKRVHSHEAKLHNLLYFVEGDAIKATNLIRSGVDFATVILDKDAKCEIAFHPLETMAATVIGPGTVSISESHAEAVTQGWRVGLKVSLSTSALVPVGELDIGISADYQKSIARTTTKIIRRDFKASVDATCTPSMIRVSAYCKPTRAHVLYGKKKGVVKEFITTINAKLLPNEADDEFFTSILGCIDYTQ